VILNKNENAAMTLACDTAITIMEAGFDLPPSVRQTEVTHALIMLRSMRSKLLREAAKPDNTEGKSE
jgi:hypothetical protein